jgi:hypothetical protein
MRDYIIKTTVLSITLILPALTLAASCSPNDNNCKREQIQLQSIQKAGIKPAPIIQATSVPMPEGDKSNKSKQPATLETTPFEIPVPVGTKTRAVTNSPDQNVTTKANTQIKSKQSSNTFTNKTTDEEEQGDTEQESTTTQQQTGTIYR